MVNSCICIKESLSLGVEVGNKFDYYIEDRKKSLGGGIIYDDVVVTLYSEEYGGIYISYKSFLDHFKDVQELRDKKIGEILNG